MKNAIRVLTVVFISLPVLASQPKTDLESELRLTMVKSVAKKGI